MTVDPWRGLLVYEEEHASVFYGRGALALEIVTRLEERGAAVLIGASGSGKSSLVRAGMLPKIRARQEQMLREAVVLTMVPGASPMSAFEEATKGAAPAMNQHVTLFVDQLEEAVTLCADHQERTRFLDALVAFAHDPNEAFLIASVRADRIEGLLEHAGFRALFQRSVEPVGHVGRSELREIIERPLDGRSVTIEPALVERISNDAGEEPGSLALVSHLLSVLWEKREGSELTIRAYEAVGGVTGVLEKRADEARDAVEEDSRSLLDRLLLCLVRRNDDGIFTRRRVGAADLVDRLMLRHDGVDSLLAPFVARRLIVMGEHVEVAHEALLRGWPHLAGLLERESEAIALRQEIERAAAVGELWSDATSNLKRAEELSAAGQLPLGENAREFLRDSRRAVQRARRLARLGMASIAGLGVVALLFAYSAIRASYKARDALREAEERSREAYASAAAAQARSPRERKNAPFSALKALQIDERLRQPPNVDRQAIIASAYAARRYGEQLVIESTRPMRDSAVRHDNTQIALVGDEPILRVVDVETGAITSTALLEGALAVGWKPLNDELVVVTSKAIEVRTDRGTKLVSRNIVNEEGLTSASVGSTGLVYTRAPNDARLWLPEPKPVKAAILVRGIEDPYLWWNEREEGFLGRRPFPDASHAFTACVLGGVWVSTRHEVEGRDLGTARRNHRFDPHETIEAVNCDVAENRVLVAAGKTLYALDPSTGEPTTLVKTPFVIRSIASSTGSDAGGFALASEDGRIRVWDGKTLDRLEELDGHVDEITSLKWMPKSSYLVSTSLDHTATIWQVGAPGLVRLLRDLPAGAQAPQLTRAGDIATFGGRELASYDGKTGARLSKLTIQGQTALAQVGFFDARVLAVSRDGDVYAWDAKTKAPVGESNSRGTVVLARDAPLAFLCRARECIVLDGDARPITQFPAPNGVIAQAVAPNGKLVAFAGEDRAWTIFDVASKTPSAPIASDAPTPHGMFAGDHLVVANARDTGLHDATGKRITTLPGNLSDVSGSSPTVRTIENGRARYFRADNGRERGSLDVGTKLHALAPDGRADALYDVVDRTVEVLRTDGTGIIAKLVGHTDAVTAVAWSADSRFIATTSEDRTLRVWDLNHEGSPVATIELEESPAELHFSRDATRIVTSDLTNRLVRLYDVSLDGAIALDCKVAKTSPDFSQVEPVCH